MKSNKFLTGIFLLLFLLLPSAYAQEHFIFHTAASSGNGTPANTSSLSILTIALIGSSGSDRVITFEASQDNTNYKAIMCKNTETLVQSTTATASSTTLLQFQCPIAGYRKVRVPVSGGSTGTVTITGTGLGGVSAFLFPSTLGSNINISNSAPTLTFTDTTALAKCFHIVVDGNIANLKECSEASGSGLGLDLATGRLFFGALSAQRGVHFTVIDAMALQRDHATSGPIFELRNANTTNNNQALIDFKTHDTGGTSRTAVRITATFTAHNAATVTGRMAFGTANAANAPTDRFFMDENGNVGLVNSVGTSGVKVFSLGLGTAPGAMTDTVQLWGADVAGAGTHGLFVRDEGSNTYSVGNGQVLVPDGGASTPVYSFTSDPDTGFRRTSSGVVQFVANGAASLLLGASTLSFGSVGAEVILARQGTANLGLGGTASATPIAQTLSVQNASGTNIAGTTWTLAGPLGTGNAAIGTIVMTAASVVQASGATAHTPVTHLTIGAGKIGIDATNGAQWGSGAEPTCNSTNRGFVVLVQAGAGVADTFRVCSKDAGDAYAYRALY